MNVNTPQVLITEVKSQGNKQVTDALLDHQTTELTREIIPQRDLWPGIERAINHQGQQ